jgi:hypothetical protein
MERESIIRETRRIAEEDGTETVTRPRFLTRSGVAVKDLQRYFDRWTDALAAAHLGPRRNLKLGDEDLLREMAAAFRRAGGIRTWTEFKRHSRYSGNAYYRCFGGWPAALVAFRDWLPANDPNFPYEDALDRAIDAVRPARGSRYPGRPARKLRLAPASTARYGPALGFRGHNCAPATELGVVLLFGTVFHELGFTVETIRPGFPDCEARRPIGRGDHWEPVRIEFEYRSSSFRDAGHDPEGCDLIVCWIHDWPDAPRPVLELRSAIRKLPGWGPGRGTP